MTETYRRKGTDLTSTDVAIRVMLIRSRSQRWMDLRAFLLDDPCVRVVADLVGAAEATAMARRLRPDVIVAGIDGQDDCLGELGARLHCASPQSKIIGLGDDIGGRLFWELGAAGAAGYIQWQGSMGSAVHIALVAAVHSDLWVASHVVAEGGFASMRPQRSDVRRACFTDLELAVLRGLLTGRRERIIAESECVSRRSVERAVASLAEKLGAPTMFLLGVAAADLAYDV